MIIALPISVIIFAFIYAIIEVKVHHEMTEMMCDTFYKVSYEMFKIDFDNVNWKVTKGFASLEAGGYDDCKYHASIIMINGVGYWLTGFGFIRAEILRRQTLVKLGYTTNGKKAIPYPSKNTPNEPTTKSN